MVMFRVIDTGCGIAPEHIGRIFGVKQHDVFIVAQKLVVAQSGVGRKAGPAGKHVKRLAVRLGLSKNTDPVKVELDLMRQLPKESWIDFSNQLVLHGRRVCKAIKPLCSACPLAAACPRNGVKKAG